MEKREQIKINVDIKNKINARKNFTNSVSIAEVSPNLPQIESQILGFRVLQVN